MSPFGQNLERDDSRRTEPSHELDVTTYIDQQTPWKPGSPNAKVHILFKEQIRIKALRLQADFAPNRSGTYYFQVLFIHLNPDTNEITETLDVSCFQTFFQETGIFANLKVDYKNAVHSKENCLVSVEKVLCQGFSYSGFSSNIKTLFNVLRIASNLCIVCVILYLQCF